MKEKQKPFKIDFWVYIVVYLLLGIFTLFLISLLFPLKASEEATNWQTYIAMLIAFIPVYLLYSKVEKGRADLCGSLRLIVKFVAYPLLSSVIFAPIFVLTYGESILRNIIVTITIYVIGTILVIFLLTVLARLNNTSFIKEFERCLLSRD